MYTALLQVIIYQLVKYERDPIKMAEKSQNAVSGKEKKIIKNNKEKTIQQQKGLPTLSADLNDIIKMLECLINIFLCEAELIQTFFSTKRKHIRVIL